MGKLKKITTILLSRNKKPKTEKWVLDRRACCKSCKYNTLNLQNYKKKLLKLLSDSLSFIMGRAEDDKLGNCTACEMCSIFFKTETKIEKCPEKLWKY